MVFFSKHTSKYTAVAITEKDQSDNKNYQSNYIVEICCNNGNDNKSQSSRKHRTEISINKSEMSYALF